MAHAPYILAKTLREAHDFARDVLGLSRGRYRVVTSPSTLSGVRNADLHLVPGYEKRHDRFAMRGALRYTRMNRIEHDVAEAPADPIDTPATEVDVASFFTMPGDPLADLEAAKALMEAEGSPVLPDPPTDEAEAPVVKRRRRRCDDCGILVEPDEVETHAASHAEVE